MVLTIDRSKVTVSVLFSLVAVRFGEFHVLSCLILIVLFLETKNKIMKKKKKCFTWFMIPITLCTKFSSPDIIPTVKIIYARRYLANKLILCILHTRQHEVYYHLKKEN